MLSEQLQNVDLDLGLWSDPVLDGVWLQGFGPLILSTEEKGPELLPDGARVGDVDHLNVVGHDGVGLTPRGVGDVVDGHLLPHQNLVGKNKQSLD